MKKTYSILFALICLFGLSAFAESSVSPLEKEEVLYFLSELNNQKIFLADEFSYPNAASSHAAPKYNRLNTFSEENGFFISGSPLEYFAYKADINNDGGEEYVLFSSGKTKKSFRVVAIYKKVRGEYIDVFSEIEKPIFSQIREWLEKEHPSQEVGFHISGITMQEDLTGKTYFTVHADNYFWGTGKWEDDIVITYKFLWDKSGLELVRAYWNP